MDPKIEVVRIDPEMAAELSSEQIPQLIAAQHRTPEPISEDNPVATPWGLTRRERDAKAEAS